MKDRRPLIAFAAIGLLTTVFLLGAFRPQVSAAAEKRDQVAAARAQERQLRDELEMLQALDAKKLRSQAKTLDSWVPSDPELSRFLRLIARASVNAGVDLRQIAPAPPTALDGADAREIVVSVLVHGTYPRVRDFTRRLEGLKRAATVSGLVMTPIDAVVNRTPTLAATMSLSIFSSGGGTNIGEEAS